MVLFANWKGDLITFEDSEEKAHRKGTKKDTNFTPSRKDVSPKFFTLLLNHFNFKKGGKSRSTVHKHCERIKCFFEKELNKAKVTLQSKYPKDNKKSYKQNCLEYFLEYLLNAIKGEYENLDKDLKMIKRMNLDFTKIFSLTA